MDRRERLLMGAHGFDWNWWIFSGSFSFLSLREIQKPRWLADLLCRFGKHSWWLRDNAFEEHPIYKCLKCGRIAKE